MGAAGVHTGDLSRVRRGLPGYAPLGLREGRGQTLAFPREGQPDPVMSINGTQAHIA